MSIEYNLGTIGSNVVLEKGNWDNGIKSLKDDERKAIGYFSSIEAKAAGVTAAFTALAAGLLTTVKKSVSGIIEYEDAADTFGVVFGKQADSVKKWSDEVAKTSRRTRADIMSMMGDYQAMFVGMGMEQNKAIDMSKKFGQIAVDLSSAWNRDLAEGVGAFRSAFSTSMEPLRGFGLSVTENDLKVRAFNMGLYDGKGILDQQAKVTALLAITQEKLAWTTGNAARSSYQFKEVTNKTKTALSEISVEIGKHLKGFLTPFYEMLTDVVDKMRELMELYPAFGKALSATMGLGAGAAVYGAGSGAMSVLGGAKAAAPVAVGGAVAGITASAATSAAAASAATVITEAIKKATKNYIKPEIMPDVTPVTETPESILSRMRSTWTAAFSNQAILGGGRSPLMLEAPKFSAYSNPALGSTRMMGAMGADEAANILRSLEQPTGKLRDAFKSLQSQTIAMVGPYKSLAMHGAAIAVAFYGITKAMEAFALPEVVSVVKDTKKAFGNAVDAISDFMDRAGLYALADMFVGVSKSLGVFWEAISKPVQTGQRMGEFWGTLVGSPGSLSERWGKAVEALEIEKAMQGIEAKNRELAAYAASAVNEFGEAVKGSSDVLKDQAKAIGDIIQKYRPEKSFAAEYLTELDAAVGSGDQAMQSGFQEAFAEGYKKLNEDQQARARLILRQYDDSLAPADGQQWNQGNLQKSFFLSETMKLAERPEATETLQQVDNMTGAIKSLVDAVVGRINAARESSKKYMDGLFSEFDKVQSEKAAIDSQIADAEWARYDRQMQVGTAATTNGEGAFMSGVLNQALSAVQAPGSQSPEERAAEEMRNAQWRSIALQERLVMLQEQMTMLMEQQAAGSGQKFAIGY